MLVWYSMIHIPLRICGVLQAGEKRSFAPGKIAIALLLDILTFARETQRAVFTLVQNKWSCSLL